MREEPTVRRAVRAMMRYGHLINESLFMKLDEADGIAVLRDELLVGTARPIRGRVIARAIRACTFASSDTPSNSGRTSTGSFAPRVTWTHRTRWPTR